jgi:predicted nucleic acid-binding protein
VILLDTSGLLSALDAAQTRHRAAADALRSAPGPLLLSPFVLAELDHLLGHRVGPAAQRFLLDEVAAGSYRLEPFGPADVRRAAEVIAAHAALAVGLADASIVVLAERHGCADVLTLDERHFRVLPGPGGRPLRLLPADG